MRLGLKNAALRKIGAITEAKTNPTGTLVRSVFGPWASNVIATGATFSQILVAEVFGI